MAKVDRAKTMAVPLDQLEAAILDFSAYPNFLEEVVGAEVVDRPGEKLAVRFELEIIKKFQYVLAFDHEPGKRIGWRLLESDLFKKNEGEWLLSKEGKQTAVRYGVEVSFGFLVPGWVTKKLTETNLPKMFDAFEKEAQRRGKTGAAK